MEKNEEKPCSTIISESEQEITSLPPISSIPDKINLEDLISEVLNPEDSTIKFLKKIKGVFFGKPQDGLFRGWEMRRCKITRTPYHAH